MRDIARIDKILEKLKKVWGSSQYNDCRLGQMMVMFETWHNIDKNSTKWCELFYIEDDDFEKLLDKELKK